MAQLNVLGNRVFPACMVPASSAGPRLRTSLAAMRASHSPAIGGKPAARTPTALPFWARPPSVRQMRVSQWVASMAAHATLNSRKKPGRASARIRLSPLRQWRAARPTRRRRVVMRRTARRPLRPATPNSSPCPGSGYAGIPAGCAVRPDGGGSRVAQASRWRACARNRHRLQGMRCVPPTTQLVQAPTRPARGNAVPA